jgi:hypothetical protein
LPLCLSFIERFEMAKKTTTKKTTAPPVVEAPPKPVTDAIYAFVTWLTTSPNRVYRVGGSEESQRVFAALSRFCTENNLPPCSEGWEDKFKYPTHFV